MKLNKTEDASNNKSSHKYQNLGMSTGMCFGVSIGMALGYTVFDNSSLGMCFGLSIGMLIGMLLGMEKDKRINAQMESEGYIVTDIVPIDEEKKEYTVIVTNKTGEQKSIPVSKAEIEAEEIQLNDLVYLDEDSHLEKITG